MTINEIIETLKEKGYRDYVPTEHWINIPGKLVDKKRLIRRLTYIPNSNKLLVHWVDNNNLGYFMEYSELSRKSKNVIETYLGGLRS